MRFTTHNEFSHFEFSEVHIAEIQMTTGFFTMCLDNVTILPENSCNRDIRKMRANGLVFKIGEGRVTQLVEEGYKVYDPDGKLMRQLEDREVLPEEYPQVAEAFADGYVYSAAHQPMDGGYRYEFVIDGTDDRTYVMTVEGTGDSEDWDRFLNPE